MAKPAKPEKLIVNIVYQPGQVPGFQFYIDGVAVPDNVITFKNQNFPGFHVHYCLDAKSFGNLVFPSDAQTALCSEVIANGNGTCPTTGIWDGFSPQQVKDSNRTLVVRNINGSLPKGQSQQKFGYTLYVTDDANGGGNFTPLDPVGVNTNGSSGVRYFSTTAVIALAVAAVAIVGVGLYAFGAFNTR